MSKNPSFKADLFVFGILMFFMAMAFSVFVLERDPQARLVLFGVSVWLLVIAAAAYTRLQKSRREKLEREEKRKEKDQS